MKRCLKHGLTIVVLIVLFSILNISIVAATDYGFSSNIGQWLTEINVGPNAEATEIANYVSAYKLLGNHRELDATILNYKEWIAEQNGQRYNETDADYFMDNFGNKMYVWKVAQYQAKMERLNLC